MAQVALPPEAMTSAWQDRITLLRDMQAAAARRFGLDPKQPHLGLVLSTQEFAGTTRRLTVVDVVLAGSAAQKAGIKPGDFIAAIGNRELDTETLKAVTLYLSDWSDVVPLTIRHGSVSRKVNLRRAPVPCLRVVYNEFPATLWQQRIGKILELTELAKREMERNASNPWALLESKQTYEKLNEITLRTIAMMDYQLNPVACVACRIGQ
mgnify:FL=1